MKTIYEFLLKSKTTTSMQDNDYVDLDLPSGLLWARCNIGAKEPTEVGDYFMWGSTEPNTNDICDWPHAPFNNGNITYNGKSFMEAQDKACPNGVLAPEYDAATAILGNEWCLPTKEDFRELIDNTKHEWINNYQGSKINGMLFTSDNGEAYKAKDADNELGTELFIPCSGYRDGTMLNAQFNGSDLWSSSIDESNYRFAWYISFDRNGCALNSFNHYYGYCLRAVMK